MEKKLDLLDELSRIFKKELNEVVKREIENPDYLPQKDFNSCEERARKGVEIATKKVIKIAAIAIAKHRKEKHNDDTATEIKALSSSLDDEEVSVSLMGYWGG